MRVQKCPNCREPLTSIVLEVKVKLEWAGGGYGDEHTGGEYVLDTLCPECGCFIGDWSGIEHRLMARLPKTMVLPGG